MAAFSLDPRGYYLMSRTFCNSCIFRLRLEAHIGCLVTFGRSEKQESQPKLLQCIVTAFIKATVNT